ncbi:Uncharacterised protein [Achromobacter xylosoxidans]|uniref:hypothetical protein n=1 Tax=Alcaligenes xylosoxydans xylosoxydans TaxID=85698 RepID=UPI0006C3C73E|nr:hypothetical protein [Achromobacter xylosoxidans]CUI31999.1 Uncharacterised protein [Achromobacter xylosoxidans]
MPRIDAHPRRALVAVALLVLLLAAITPPGAWAPGQYGLVMRVGALVLLAGLLWRYHRSAPRAAAASALWADVERRRVARMGLHVREALAQARNRHLAQQAETQARWPVPGQAPVPAVRYTAADITLEDAVRSGDRILYFRARWRDDGPGQFEGRYTEHGDCAYDGREVDPATARRARLASLGLALRERATYGLLVPYALALLAMAACARGLFAA